ncbi:glycosyltransferase [Fodinisporobacter ferrooxydans]|uniref:Glycosyltransferase n=1 Tax=Fodinisporobacter ferrooxydans TaxID=2901836 RepID=A0ABY4CJD8_9BACL|nr:glycosyltransferase [Alicyclobacillaceae bacterium MYW30-H2]
MYDVGIVMPVYIQNPVYLRSAIRSILMQSYAKFTLVIVLDGVPSETKKLIQEETKGDHRVQIIVKKENQGIAKALNAGFDQLLQQSDIEYFTWISSDNIYYPMFIGTLRDALKEAPRNVGLVYSSFRHIDLEGNCMQSEQDLVNFRKSLEKPKEYLLDVDFIGVSFMYKKQYAALLDGYVLEPVEDYEYWLRLTEHCDIKYVPLELIDYRVDSTHSVSAQLHSSKEQHRRWRYAFNLAKHLARIRRKIPFEVTVIFPVSDNTYETIQKLDTLLDQSAYPPFYSNYKIEIYDLTPDTSAIPVLRPISDPRITFHAMPNRNEKEVLAAAVQNITTPFTMLYGKEKFPSNPYVFYNLILKHHQLSKIPQYYKDVIATFEKYPGVISYRRSSEDGVPISGDLYQTNTLQQMAKNNNSRAIAKHMIALPKILVNSVPKSGTNLLTQIIQGIPGMEQDRLDFYYHDENYSFHENYRELLKIQSGQFAVGHIPYHSNLAVECKQRLIKQIMIYRDLRDVAVSWSHFISTMQQHPLYPAFQNRIKSREQRLLAIIRGTKLLPMEIPNGYEGDTYPNIYEEFKPIYDWMHSPDICSVRYEDLMKNEISRYTTLLKIVEFLWSDLKQLQLEKHDIVRFMEQNINPERSATYRQGKIGSWREEFNQEHKEAFKRIAGNFLLELGYETDPDW